MDVEAGGFDVDHDRWVSEEGAEGIAVAVGCGLQEVAQTEADFFGEGADFFEGGFADAFGRNL